jgi:uroporphyrinogen decarboxylase
MFFSLRRKNMQFKQDRMTSEERIEALLNRKPVDRVPFFGLCNGFNALNVGYKVADSYNDPNKSFNAAVWTIEQYNWERLPFIAYASLGGWEFGGDIEWPDGEFDQAPHITRYPVATEEEAWNLKLPDIKSAGIVPIFLEFSQLAEKGGYRRYFTAVEEPFVTATNICNIERFCRWIIKKPELAHHVLRLATDFKIELARYLANNVGTERLIPFNGDAAATNYIITPKTFKEFALPYSKELHQRMLAMGFKHLLAHICGEQNKNYPYWAQIPMGDPGIISVSSKVAFETAIKYFPNDIIMGNIDPPLIQTGSPRQVYEHTRICIEKGKKAPGGFILAPGCELPPKSPPYNVWMIMKAINDFGWY